MLRPIGTKHGTVPPARLVPRVALHPCGTLAPHEGQTRRLSTTSLIACPCVSTSGRTHRRRTRHCLARSLVRSGNEGTPRQPAPPACAGSPSSCISPTQTTCRARPETQPPVLRTVRTSTEVCSLSAPRPRQAARCLPARATCPTTESMRQSSVPLASHSIRRSSGRSAQSHFRLRRRAARIPGCHHSRSPFPPPPLVLYLGHGWLRTRAPTQRGPTRKRGLQHNGLSTDPKSQNGASATNCFPPRAAVHSHTPAPRAAQMGSSTPPADWKTPNPRPHLRTILNHDSANPMCMHNLSNCDSSNKRSLPTRKCSRHKCASRSPIN